MTLATLPIRPDEVARFGVVDVSKAGEVHGLSGEAEGDQAALAVQSGDGGCLDGHLHFQHRRAAAGADPDAEDPNSKHDFGHNILPSLLGKYKMLAYNFVDENSKELYWRDVGTLDAYYEANMDLCRCRRSSTCMTRTGRCARGSGSIRRRSLCSASRDERAWR